MVSRAGAASRARAQPFRAGPPPHLPRQAPGQAPGRARVRRGCAARSAAVCGPDKGGRRRTDRAQGRARPQPAPPAPPRRAMHPATEARQFLRWRRPGTRRFSEPQHRRVEHPAIMWGEHEHRQQLAGDTDRGQREPTAELGQSVEAMTSAPRSAAAPHRCGRARRSPPPSDQAPPGPISVSSAGNWRGRLCPAITGTNWNNAPNIRSVSQPMVSRLTAARLPYPGRPARPEHRHGKAEAQIDQGAAEEG